MSNAGRGPKGGRDDFIKDYTLLLGELDRTLDLADRPTTERRREVLAVRIKPSSLSQYRRGNGVKPQLEGAAPTRVVISQWKSVDDAKKFYSSPAVKTTFEDRKKFTAGARVFIV